MFLFFGYGCSGKKEVTLTVINRSNRDVDKLHIRYPASQFVMENLEVGIQKMHTFSIPDSMNFKGAFLYMIEIDDVIRSEGTFGYFSNFYNIRSHYKIMINEKFEVKQQD